MIITKEESRTTHCKFLDIDVKLTSERKMIGLQISKPINTHCNHENDCFNEHIDCVVLGGKNNYINE